MGVGPTGRYETTVFLGEAVRAFVPDPLPFARELDFTQARHRRLNEAMLMLGRLDSVSLLLPDPEIFLYAYVRKEAVLSSQIEGTQSSLSDLLVFEAEAAPGVPIDDVREVSCYVAALEHGMRRMREGFPLSNRLIREMHAELLAGGRGADKLPGEFRTSQNWIGGTRPGNALFVPPPPAHVLECMANLELFWHREDLAYPSPVRAAIAHVQFETIHPFLDGNGRIGRLLIALLLHQDDVLSRPLLYLSLFLKRHRSTYYELLMRVRQEGAWEAWLDFFFDGIIFSAENAVSTARSLVDLVNRDRQRIPSVGRTAANVMRVFDHFVRRPVATIKTVSAATGLTFPTVDKALRKLMEIGVVNEITDRKRDRVFAYAEYLAYLHEGT
ncbi:MAG: Fic family protein [Fimbriimonadaceae bacterium]|nr:Fic family protein [Fimbriimonadaceae bacterium]